MAALPAAIPGFTRPPPAHGAPTAADVGAWVTYVQTLSAAQGTISAFDLIQIL